MNNQHDVKVPIKRELKKQLVFGLKARPPIAIILSFFGCSHEVYELMQTLSHSTRAFIFNAQGLKSFFTELDLSRILQEAYESDQLVKAMKYQPFDHNELQQALTEQATTARKLRYLSQTYPHIYRFVLVHLNQTEALEKYEKKCMTYLNRPKKYYLYIHGYFLPWLDQQRMEAKLTKGKQLFEHNLWYCRQG